MDGYNSLGSVEQEAIEKALNTLTKELGAKGLRLAMDDRSARAAEALAQYIIESRK